MDHTCGSNQTTRIDRHPAAKEKWRRCAAPFLVLLGFVTVATGCGSQATGSKLLPRFYSFHSRPDLHPPSVTIKQKASAVSPGYTFFAPKKQVKQHGPLIVDNDGHVVWFDPLAHEATDFRVQQYQGKRVLTWWQGRSIVGNGHGHYVLMNDHYHVIKTVYATHGLDGDQHEFLLTPQGTALITAYKPVSGDVSAVGGPKRGKILDCFLQEIDVATGRLVFEWNALDHVAITESYWQLQKVKGKWPPYDFFHINSIDQEPNGDFLVSARNTHALYEIDHRTGKIIWRLGGKKSDFLMGKGTVFNWQHDARRLPHGDISVFDDGAFPKVEDDSRALILHVDAATKKVTLVKAYVSPDKLLSHFEGSMQVLPNGHAFVGWGSEPYFTEFARNGSTVFDAFFGKDRDTYRAYRFPWVGRPSDEPALVVDGGTAYVSWNGATQVATWRLVDASGKRLADAKRRDFETTLSVPKGATRVQAQALDANGTVLGSSKLVSVS